MASGFFPRLPEEHVAGYLPEDADTMRLIQFSCSYPTYSSDTRHKRLLLLLHRFMPKDAIDVTYVADHHLGEETCTISCWLSDAEIALVADLTGCTDGDEANEKVLTEAMDILEEGWSE